MKKKKNEATSLMDLVAHRASLGSNQGKYRAALVAHLAEIQDVLAAGYGWRIVWQTLCESGRIDMSYDTFRRACLYFGLSKLQPRSQCAHIDHRVNMGRRFLNGSLMAAGLPVNDQGENSEISNIV